jgi:hypothetical protein
MTVVLKCNCKHIFQDSEYGFGYRLMNKKASEKTGGQEVTCTVCGVVHKVK